MQRNALPCNGMFGHVLKRPGDLFELSHCPNLQGFVYLAAPTSPATGSHEKPKKKTRKNSINKTDRWTLSGSRSARSVTKWKERGNGESGSVHHWILSRAGTNYWNYRAWSSAVWASLGFSGLLWVSLGFRHIVQLVGCSCQQPQQPCQYDPVCGINLSSNITLITPLEFWKWHTLVPRYCEQISCDSDIIKEQFQSRWSTLITSRLACQHS